MKINKINNAFFFILAFLSFVGFYFIILMAKNTLNIGNSQLITIPVRILVVFSCVLLFVLNLKSYRLNNAIRLITFFFIIYFYRVLYEIMNNSFYYLNYDVLLMYFVSFAVLPTIIIGGIKINSINLDHIFKGLLYSGFLFSIAALIFYSDYLGNISRLNGTSTDEGVVNPLILSYNSILIVGAFLFYLFYNKTSKINIIIIISSVILSVIPFLLGASRGSLVALIVSIFVVIFFSKSRAKIKYLIFLLILIFLVSFLDSYFNSGLIARFQSLESDYDSGAGSAIRLTIWKSSLNQFADSPFIGGKLAVDNWINYPHNIFLEVLQTTGIFGFIFFFSYIIFCFKSLIFIIKKQKKYIWLVIIFLQALTQNFFSGNLYTAAWFWLSSALILAVYYNINKVKI